MTSTSEFFKSVSIVCERCHYTDRCADCPAQRMFDEVKAEEEQKEKN